MKLKPVGFSLPLALAASLLVTACGGVNLWPFGENGNPTRSRAPKNSTEYLCNADKHFYVRFLDNDASAWIIFPDREVRLDKVAGTPNPKYTNGVGVLELNGNEATLSDGPNSLFSGCKVAGSADTISKKTKE